MRGGLGSNAPETKPDTTNPMEDNDTTDLKRTGTRNTFNEAHAERLRAEIDAAIDSSRKDPFADLRETLDEFDEFILELLERVERLEARVAALEEDPDEATLDLSMLTGDLADNEAVKQAIDARSGGPR